MGYDMVNMQKQNQCETGRGSRQMPRHLLPCLLDNLHWSLLNHHQPTILCRLGLPCMLPAAHLWRHLGLLVTVWERVSQPRCACTCTAMCHGLWGFKLYCVQVYGQWKEQWKETAYPEVIRSSSLFPAGSANTWSPCTSGFWVGGATTTMWEWCSTQKSEQGGRPPSCTSAVTLAWLSQHGPQWAVYLWIHDCKYPSVWEKVLSLRLCIWVTPGRTLNINKVRNHWLVWCYTNNVHLYGSHLLRSTSYKISFQPKHWVAFVTVTRFLSVLPLLIQCAINMTYLQHLQGVWREHIYCLGLLSRSMGSGW